MNRPIRFLLFGVLLVLPSPVHGRRFEPIDAQTPPRGAASRLPHLRIDSPRDGAVVAPGDTLQVTVSSPDRTRVAVIEIDIERREMPRAITLRLPQVYFEKKGETGRIELVGDFGNGDIVDVTESSRVTFESSDTAVATVNKSGTITAVGTGHAAVVAWYGPRARGIKASIRRSTVTETLMVTDHGQRYPLTSYACKEKFEYLTWSA
jgi:hypothetical protein